MRTLTIAVRSQTHIGLTTFSGCYKKELLFNTINLFLEQSYYFTKMTGGKQLATTQDHLRLQSQQVYDMSRQTSSV